MKPGQSGAPISFIRHESESAGFKLTYTSPSRAARAPVPGARAARRLAFLADKKKESPSHMDIGLS